MGVKESPEAKTFRKYLETRKILIADGSASARSGLFKVFQELGAKTTQVTLVNSFKQAAEQIQALKPHIVVAEYELGKRCGLDLFQGQREQNPKESKEILFFVVTGNTSQSAVARAAEEDIDGYIIKPFTVEVVRKTIMRAALTKIQPPPYLVAIDEGKAALEEGNLDAAEESFSKAMELDPAPTLACYYVGQVKFLRKIMEEAKGNYSQGLEYNKIHYKCMVGLYELLSTQKNHSQAYEVVKRISQYFPANPKRLGEVLRLAIMNSKYEDVEKYYAIFCNIDERDEVLIKYICAALVVCGKYYLSSGSKSRALELFQKAAATGTGRVKILKEIVQALIDHEFAKDARNFLAKFPPESQSGEEYALLNFQILDVEDNAQAVIATGRELISRGMKSEGLYMTMIKRSLQAKMGRAVESLVHEAIQLFPHRKEELEAVSRKLEEKAAS